MEFYPSSFTIEPGQQRVHTQLSGKRIALSDVRVSIHAVDRPEDTHERFFSAPSFELKPNGGGWDLTWYGELKSNVCVVLKAQGAGGQTICQPIALRVTGVADAPEPAPEPAAAEPEPAEPAEPPPSPAPKTALERYWALIDAGLDHGTALGAIATQFGADASAEVQEALTETTPPEPEAA